MGVLADRPVGPTHRMRPASEAYLDLLRQLQSAYPDLMEAAHHKHFMRWNAMEAFSDTVARHGSKTPDELRTSVGYRFPSISLPEVAAGVSQSRQNLAFLIELVRLFLETYSGPLPLSALILQNIQHAENFSAVLQFPATRTAFRNVINITLYPRLELYNAIIYTAINIGIMTPQGNINRFPNASSEDINTFVLVHNLARQINASLPRMGQYTPFHTSTSLRQNMNINNSNTETLLYAIRVSLVTPVIIRMLFDFLTLVELTPHDLLSEPPENAPLVQFAIAPGQFGDDGGDDSDDSDDENAEAAGPSYRMLAASSAKFWADVPDVSEALVYFL